MQICHAAFMPISYRIHTGIHTVIHAVRRAVSLPWGGRKGPVRERPYDARRTAHD